MALLASWLISISRFPRFFPQFMTILNFNGFIRDIVYTSYLNPKTEIYNIQDFNINNSKPFGIISFDLLQNNIAYSRWTSPKRTRTYPFAKIYNTF
jgi:hypothetical protein